MPQQPGIIIAGNVGDTISCSMREVQTAYSNGGDPLLESNIISMGDRRPIPSAMLGYDEWKRKKVLEVQCFV